MIQSCPYLRGFFVNRLRRRVDRHGLFLDALLILVRPTIYPTGNWLVRCLRLLFLEAFVAAHQRTGIRLRASGLMAVVVMVVDMCSCCNEQSEPDNHSWIEIP